MVTCLGSMDGYGYLQSYPIDWKAQWWQLPCIKLDLKWTDIWLKKLSHDMWRCNNQTLLEAEYLGPMVDWYSNWNLETHFVMDNIKHQALELPILPYLFVGLQLNHQSWWSYHLYLTYWWGHNFTINIDWVTTFTLPNGGVTIPPSILVESPT